MFIVVSRQALIESKFSSVVCARILATRWIKPQVSVGPEEGLKKESSIRCDGLVSLSMPLLTHVTLELDSAEFSS